MRGSTKLHLVGSLIIAVLLVISAVLDSFLFRTLLIVPIIYSHHLTLVFFGKEYDEEGMEAWNKYKKKLEAKLTEKLTKEIEVKYRKKKRKKAQGNVKKASKINISEYLSPARHQLFF